MAEPAQGIAHRLPITNRKEPNLCRLNNPKPSASPSCAATGLGLVYADEIGASQIAIGIVGATFVLAFSVQRQKVKSLMTAERDEHNAG
ncbi:hypothetical protein BFW89_17455 [Pseudomonas synxantha]|jgi:hypothetical protein|nr:hypothetical protein BFW89_17455 [Pseudomonas synxantha]